MTGFLFIVLIVSISIYILSKKYPNLGNKEEIESLQSFENRINNWGFTKRIVAYDFIVEGTSTKETKEMVVSNYGLKNSFTVGIWLNYQKKLIALRLDRNARAEIEIPFNKIQKVEIIENGYSKTTGGAIAVGPIIVGSAKSKEISQGLQIRIVIGDLNSGTHTYFVKLIDPIFRLGFFINKVNKSNPYYKDVMECANRIIDEVEYIMRHAEQ